ncbi:MAG: hypothetical protein ACC658_09425 [Acidimicrobiia bacterium]
MKICPVDETPEDLLEKITESEKVETLSDLGNVTVGGVEGIGFEVVLSSNLGITSGVDLGYFMDQGATHQVYIIEVAGKTVFIDAFAAGADAKRASTLAILRQIVDSIVWKDLS